MTLTVRTEPIDDDRPLLDLVPVDAPLAWVRGGEGLVAWGEVVRVTPGPDRDRFGVSAATLAAVADDVAIEDDVGVPGGGVVGFVSLTFDPRSSGSVLVVPEVTIGRRDGTTWLTRIGDGDAPGPIGVSSPEVAVDRVRYAGSSMPDLHWLEAVASAIARIDGGGIDKVVLARDHAVWAERPFDARTLLRRLAARFPGCSSFLVDGLIGATPELLVRRTGERVEALPLAGSAARGADPTADAALGRALLASDKDRREHAFAVATVRSALAERCAELTVDAEPWLLRLDNVQHLATRLRGRLRADETVLDLGAALHPTAAVGGTPTDAAVALIRELEGMDRGRYAGPVGWVAADGDGELGIALRCAELSGARARLFAGAGIVAGSLPEAELEETRLKLRAMMSVLES